MREFPRTCALVLALAVAACANGTQEVDSLNTSAAKNAGDDKSAASIMKVGDATRAGGDLGTAINLYRRAHELAPEDPAPLAKLAATLGDAGALQEANEAWSRVLKKSPNDTEAMRGLAAVMIQMNQPDLALAQLDKAIAVRKEAKTYSLMGVANDLIGNHADAQRAYADGLALSPEDLSLRNNMGLSQALSGDYAAATRVLTFAAQSPTATPRTRQNLALAYGLAGESEKAASVARRDLDEESVRNNLRFYAMLRGLDDRSRAAAIIGARSPSAAANAESAANRDAVPVIRNDGEAAPLPAPVPVVDASPLAAPLAAPAKAPAKPRVLPPKPQTQSRAPAAIEPVNAEAGKAETGKTEAEAGEPATEAPAKSGADADEHAAAPAPLPQPTAEAPALAPAPAPAASVETVAPPLPAAPVGDSAAAAEAPALQTAAAEAPVVAKPARARLYHVQAGTWREAEGAERVCADLVGKGFDVHTATVDVNGTELHLCRTSAPLARAEAQLVAERIAAETRSAALLVNVPLSASR